MMGRKTISIPICCKFVTGGGMYHGGGILSGMYYGGWNLRERLEPRRRLWMKSVRRRVWRKSVSDKNRYLKRMEPEDTKEGNNNEDTKEGDNIEDTKTIKIFEEDTEEGNNSESTESGKEEIGHPREGKEE